MKKTPPCYGEAGWLQWPDHEEYSQQFMRVFGTAQEGASTISECFHAAKLVDPGNDESWCAAWQHVAEINRARGDDVQLLSYCGGVPGFEGSETQTTASKHEKMLPALS
jgi:hypothetical protein